MSNLQDFAEKELRRAGLFDQDADYGPGKIAECVMEMVKAFSSYSHSGGSMEMTLAIFDKVVRFKPLSPLTNDPDEWMEIGPSMFQSRRSHSCFSADGGQTYYDLDGPGGIEKTYTAKDKADASV